MNSFLYEIIVYEVEALISCIFLMNMLQTVHNKISQLVLWCEIVAVVMLVTPSFSFLRIATLTVLEFIFTCYFYRDKIKKKAYVFLFKEAILSVSAGISYLIYSSLVEWRVLFSTICRSKDCTYCILYLLMFSVLSSIVFQFTTVFTKRFITEIFAETLNMSDFEVYADGTDASILFPVDVLSKKKDCLIHISEDEYKNAHQKLVSKYIVLIKKSPEIFATLGVSLMLLGIYIDQYMSFMANCTYEMFVEICEKADFKISEAQLVFRKGEK